MSAAPAEGLRSPVIIWNVVVCPGAVDTQQTKALLERIQKPFKFGKYFIRQGRDKMTVIYQIYSYIVGLLQWYWGNHMVSSKPEK